MRAVNLLPRDAQRSSSSSGRAPLFVLAGGLAVVTAAAAVLFVSTSGAISGQRADLDAVQSQVATSGGSGLPTAGAGLVAQERTDRVAALAAALSSRVPVDRLLRQLAYVLPEDVWLTGLAATAPGADSAATAAPSGGASASQRSAAVPGVTIQGATYTHESVARALARLAILPTLDGVRLTSSARVLPGAAIEPGAGSKTKKARSIVTFTITASFAGGQR